MRRIAEREQAERDQHEDGADRVDAKRFPEGGCREAQGKQKSDLGRDGEGDMHRVSDVTCAGDQSLAQVHGANGQMIPSPPEMAIRIPVARRRRSFPAAIQTPYPNAVASMV